MPQLFTTHDVAAMLQMDPSSITKWVSRGFLTAYRTPGGHRRIREDHLREFILKQGMPMPQQLGGAVLNAPGMKPSLLLLDDRWWLEKSVRALESDFDVHATTAPLEAMLMLAEGRHPHFLLELGLKAPSCLDVVTQVRSWPSLQHVRVAVMSALPSRIAGKRAVAAGAVAFLAKPLNARDVADVLLPA